MDHDKSHFAWKSSFYIDFEIYFDAFGTNNTLILQVVKIGNFDKMFESAI